jgi:hypothetical protein
MLAGALFAAGLMSFELISCHLSKSKVASEHWISVMLAISTAFWRTADGPIRRHFRCSLRQPDRACYEYP